MENKDSLLRVPVVWRGNKYIVEMHPDASVKNLGNELQKLTGVKPDTMRLIVPKISNKGSKLLSPFSDEHSQLSLQKASIIEEKSIRMMGVSEDEVEKVLQDAKVDLRIAGFEEEERRMRQRMSYGPSALIKLPQGPYTFCDFRTLQIPGIELNPPASEALKRMHMLAADPGIVAIMNKHRWRVGIMTEMAPVGYVGVSPKCILGLNKNHGEEISLRLRTDDLKGFRKYESIKKTLLHELAHMVYSDHDANFYALDKQLNQEAASLNWTKSGGQTLSAVRHLDDYEGESYSSDNRIVSQKLGGNASDQLASARASSVAAAYRRLDNSADTSGLHDEPDPDDSGYGMFDKPDAMEYEPDLDGHSSDQNKFEPELDSQSSHNQVDTLNSGIQLRKTIAEPDPDELEVKQRNLGDGNFNKAYEEPDPDDSRGNTVVHAEPDPDDCLTSQAIASVRIDERMSIDELDPVVSQQKRIKAGDGNNQGPEQIKAFKEPDPDPDESQVNGLMQAEPDPDDYLTSLAIPGVRIGERMSIDEPDPDESRERQTNSRDGDNQGPEQIKIKAYKEPDPDESQLNRGVQAEPDPDDEELQRIQDPVTAVCRRLQKSVEMLRAEANPTEATVALQTLLKIIRNIIEHPNEMKFQRLRKANPTIQKNVVNHKAAMEILQMVGFIEDSVFDGTVRAETYIVLKRNDPGLLWLVKSSLEACGAC